MQAESNHCMCETYRLIPIDLAIKVSFSVAMLSSISKSVINNACSESLDWEDCPMPQ